MSSQLLHAKLFTDHKMFGSNEFSLRGCKSSLLETHNKRCFLVQHILRDR